MRIAKRDIRTADNLVSQVVVSFVRRIEPQLQAFVRRNLVDERSSVTAESRPIPDNALGIVADNPFVVHLPVI